MRESISLIGTWRCQPDPAFEGEALGWARPEHDTTPWPEAMLPATFERCLPILASYEGAVWFRRVVEVPAGWQDKHVELHFAGANYHTQVWVNGECVGTNDDGFLPFSFPVTDVLRYGEPNIIVVRVDNIRREGEVPGLQRGWRAYGGLLREVKLVVMDPVHLAEMVIEAEPSGEYAVRTSVVNQRSDRVEITVRVTVAGTQTATTVPISANATAVASLTGVAANVRPWSPDDPVRYPLRLELCVNDEVVDERPLQIGFRRLETRGEQLFLNGAPLYLRGVNRHEDSPRTNAATDLEQVRRDLQHIKSLGMNFVRLCHYPHHPGELDLCDEMGLLVMDEIPLYWWNGLAEGEEKCACKLEAAKRQISRMMARDRNHPCVIFWSVSNETEETRPEVAEGNAALIRLAKSLDSTRLAVHVSDKWSHTPHFEADDIICVNGYPSWAGRIWRNDPHYDLTESRRWWEEHLAQLHAQFPDKPILITEFGYPCFAGILENAMGEDVQAEVIRTEYEAFHAPYLCGATIWCYADHPWPEENFINYMTTSPFGLVTRERNPKRACRVVEEMIKQE